MSILADQTALSQCAPWCRGHLPTVDGQVIHISPEKCTPLGEGAVAHVSIELAPGQAPAVRVQGAGDAPMSPAQAMQLAAVLITEAFAAMTWEAQR